MPPAASEEAEAWAPNDCPRPQSTQPGVPSHHLHSTPGVPWGTVWGAGRARVVKESGDGAGSLEERHHQGTAWHRATALTAVSPLSPPPHTGQGEQRGLPAPTGSLLVLGFLFTSHLRLLAIAAVSPEAGTSVL